MKKKVIEVPVMSAKVRSLALPCSARSFVSVASWPMEFDIEIECVAVA
ncbi:hypothetical protein GCM10010869_57230 [Mesorhizobium tianshanense]|uniref:Uncharacterized protein n=1 Tax=Mesorhizobium tianshanense TaxID=39844 RepID=A0A562NZR0_9HYPH|nr:hypothetical protein [Mesorhizobium tianshanense]TWI37591.1 hypothetical protein IQ26_02473 [Mesorhizobium tianshanense]GLS40126.1 hypothetical protein GCM10010869_57230 [Mesorhizobium tianshanense]